MNELNRVDIKRIKDILKQKLLKRMSGPGDYPTAIKGLSLHRRDAVNKPENCFYSPKIVKIVQGCKHSSFGSDSFAYGEDEVLVAGMDMPNTSVITEACPEKPCMSMVIELDQSIIAQLAADIHLKKMNSSTRGLLIQKAEPELLDAFLRLEELMDKPEQISVMAPMIIREIYYLLLIGPNGHQLCSFHVQGSQRYQIARATAWLRRNFHKSMQVDKLADMFNMAPSTFHKHFKEITTLSPLQFQKRLRLHEAKILMISQNYDCGEACQAVGYESLTQFNREYKRLFGEPPHRDIRRRHEADDGFSDLRVF